MTALLSRRELERLRQTVWFNLRCTERPAPADADLWLTSHARVRSSGLLDFQCGEDIFPKHENRGADLLPPVSVRQRLSEFTVIPATLHEPPAREKDEASCADGRSGCATEIVELSAKLAGRWRALVLEIASHFVLEHNEA